MRPVKALISLTVIGAFATMRRVFFALSLVRIPPQPLARARAHVTATRARACVISLEISQLTPVLRRCYRLIHAQIPSGGAIAHPVTVPQSR